MFADRLNMLFEDSPRFGRPVTQAVVADGLAASGSRLSRPYLSQLRRSRRTNPSPDVVAVLANFFGVDDKYFYLPVDSEGRNRRLSSTVSNRGRCGNCWLQWSAFPSRPQGWSSTWRNVCAAQRNFQRSLRALIDRNVLL